MPKFHEKTLSRSRDIKIFRPGRRMYMYTLSYGRSVKWRKTINEMGGNIPGGKFLGGNFPGGDFPGWSLMGGNFRGRNFPRTQNPINFNWFKNVLLELFSLQLDLFFFHKIIKFYKDICCAFVVLFIVTDWRHMRRKNTIEISSIYYNVLLWIFSN